MQDKNEILNEKDKIEEENIPSMEEFEGELYESFKKIYEGDLVEGKIIAVTDHELLVSIGYISDGIIPVAETLADDENTIRDLYHEGDCVKAEIVKTDDGEGNVLLSIKKAQEVIIWDELKDVFEQEKVISVKVKEVVKGGVVCIIGGVRSFIPASLLSTHYVEDLQEFVGAFLDVKIIELNPETRKIILSRKAVEIDENAVKKEALLETIKKGDKFMGTVVKLMNFGAFVDIGGVQGLLHNNDLSWKRIKHPSEIVKEGERVEVYIIDVDQKSGKISFGLKDIGEDPWKSDIKQFSVGQVIDGDIQRLTNYGAFVKIADGIEGLVHISEMSEKRIAKPQDIASVGDKVKVKILGIDTNTKRIQLSMKNVEDAFDEKALEKFQSSEEATTSLESVFKVFLKDIREE